MKKTKTKPARTQRSPQQSIPLPALVLGFAGLIPFVSAGVASILFGNELQSEALFALGAYGAVILSFLGGVNWGAALLDKHALQQWTPLGLSVLPSIIAWFALLLPLMAMLGVLAVAFVGQYYLDSKSVQNGVMPTWYGRLRIMLTTGAVLSLLAGLVFLVG